MKENYNLKQILTTSGPGRAGQLGLFAFINLGFVESLANGSIGANEAVARLYFAENCLFVSKVRKDKAADLVMSRGVQLPDLFDCLEREGAHREFLHELATTRRLRLTLLERESRVA